MKYRFSAALALAACTLLIPAASAQSASFQNAILTGSGNTITATWIPVDPGTGTIMYVNLTLQFDVDSSGNLTVSAGFPQQSPAPVAFVTSFLSGNYGGPSTVNNGKNLITVSGPGITVGGATVWAATASSGASAYSFPASASWYTGGIDNNPLADRLKKAGITSEFYSYGTCGSTSQNDNWPVNGIIGVSQVGNTITFVSFSNRTKGDSASPVDQITYTFLPPQK